MEHPDTTLSKNWHRNSTESKTLPDTPVQSECDEILNELSSNVCTTMLNTGKKPPTAFIDSEDWGIYLRVCCQLKQIKRKYSCSEVDAKRFMFGTRNTRRACIIRLITAFNYLYSEYSRLSDKLSQCKLDQNMNHTAQRNVKYSTENPWTTQTQCTSSEHVSTSRRALHCRKCRKVFHEPIQRRYSPSCQGDTGACVTEIALEHQYDHVSERLRSQDGKHRKNASCSRNTSTSHANCTSTDKFLATEPSTSGGTMPDSTSTSIQITPVHTSSLSHEISQTSARTQKVIAPSHDHMCFPWCRKNSPKHNNTFDWNCKREALKLSKRLRKSSDFSLNASLTSHGYYDQVRRVPAENSLVIYQVPSYQHLIEHRALLNEGWLSGSSPASAPSMMQIKFADDILKSVRLPIALELILPKMQRQIEEVMLHCQYIYDPLEVAAELRLVNYDTQACVAYFHRTRPLRCIIHEFLPDTKEHNQRKDSKYKPSNSSIVPKLGATSPTIETTMSINSTNRMAFLGCLLEMQSQVNMLKVCQTEAAELLGKLRNFVLSMSNQLSELLEERIVTKICASPNLGKLISTQHASLPFSQLTKLTQENRALKLTLRMEENRRKAVFNMMQEYLGNIRVYCRCRSIPQTTPCIDVRSIDTILLSAGPDSGTEQYKFDRVFEWNASQAEVYTELAPSVCSFLDGYNVCFLTYGGEASGKTYTLLGTEGMHSEHQGIAQRALRTVLSERDARYQDWEYHLEVAVVEVYNDSLNDLLGSEAGVHVRVDSGLENIMENLQSITIQDESDIEQLLTLCRARRKTGQTALNLHSSRSHLIILARLNSRSRIHETEICSVLALCDLAGFEDIIKADTLLNPVLAKEAGYINRSLTALNRVFMSLRTQDPSTVSYRDSKLTYLLKPFFTYSGKCILIVTVRTDKGNVASTQSTLRFGRDSRGVSLGRARRQFNLDRLIDDMRAA